MRKVNAGVFLSLDGVMQAPGGPTEDWTGGFAHGGWVAGFWDSLADEAIGRLFTPPYALLLGRRTYDIFAAHWPYVTGDEAAFGTALTAADKYVLTHRDDGLEWDNTHRLADIDAVAALKAGDGPDLLIQGSSTLYAPLLAAGLIDRVTTLVFPLVLGKGRRIFGADTPATTLTMVEHQVSPRGLIVASYEPAGPVATASFALPEQSAREQARQQRMAAEG